MIRLIASKSRAGDNEYLCTHPPSHRYQHLEMHTHNLGLGQAPEACDASKARYIGTGRTVDNLHVYLFVDYCTFLYTMSQRNAGPTADEPAICRGFICLPTNCHIGLDLHVASALHMHACVRACVRVLALMRGRARDSRAPCPRIYRICRPCTLLLSLSHSLLALCVPRPVCMWPSLDW